MGRNGETARKKGSIEHGEKGRGQRVGGRRIASLEVGGKARMEYWNAGIMGLLSEKQ
jgi:hypothetical protein